MSFVGYRQVNSAKDLETLIAEFAIRQPSYYFLRWVHRVSGITATLPQNFPSPEGQLFNAKLELRWKRQGTGYSLLLLSEAQDGTDGFEALAGDWETMTRSAHCHDSKETQYPKGFQFHGVGPQQIQQIQQRYFCDRRTATIHFIALTIGEKP